MSTLNYEPQLFIRYLNLLGVPKREPSIEALKEIVRAQLFRVPFENISKLYYLKHQGLHHLIEFKDYLDGIEHYKFGGTCYSNNYYMNQLLTYLGYDVKLCGADMKNPDVHIVNIVTVNGREFLVDVGYAAPFLEPIPRDLSEDYIISFGSDRYILKPKDQNFCSRLELYRNGSLRHGYRVKPIQRSIRDFQKVIADSFKSTATFMNALLLVRFDHDRSYVIHNMTFIESQGITSKKNNIATFDKLADLIEMYFGMPRAIVEEVLSELQIIRDAWD